MLYILTATSYLLSPSALSGFSKSGGLINVTTPESEILNKAAVYKKEKKEKNFKEYKGLGKVE